MAERPRRRSFGPTVLAGLAGAGLAALGGARTWASATGDAAGVQVEATAKGSTSAPLVVALALVTLAAWGVVLVLRGRPRQVGSVLGALASAGVLAATVAAAGRVRADATDAVVARGATDDVLGSALTGWFWATLVGAALTLLAFVVAVREARRWPAMGSRYDAPAARPAADPEQDCGTRSTTAATRRPEHAVRAPIM